MKDVDFKNSVGCGGQWTIWTLFISMRKIKHKFQSKIKSNVKNTIRKMKRIFNVYLKEFFKIFSTRDFQEIEKKCYSIFIKIYNEFINFSFFCSSLKFWTIF